MVQKGVRVSLFLKYDREIGKWSENREIPDLWGRVDRYVFRTTGLIALKRNSRESSLYKWLSWFFLELFDGKFKFGPLGFSK